MRLSAGSGGCTTANQILVECAARTFQKHPGLCRRPKLHSPLVPDGGARARNQPPRFIGKFAAFANLIRFALRSYFYGISRFIDIANTSACH